jgi:hypothetical protein
MSEIISDVLDVNREARKPFALRAPRTLIRSTFNPSKASPGETLKVKIPKLDDGDVYVPKSIFLVFDLILTKSHVNDCVVNNLSRNLVEKMKISYGGITIQELENYDMYMTYKDLYKQKYEREDMLLQGVSSVNMRKLRTGAGDKVTSDASEVALAAVYNRRYKIPLSHEILDDHGVFNMRALGYHPDSARSISLLFEIKLAQSKDVCITSDPSKSFKYSLDNIELEYQIIHSDYLANETALSYKLGKGFYYEMVDHYKDFDIIKDTTLINEEVNKPLRCLTGILMLFVENHVNGARDSEKFVNPNITSIKIKIGGKPSKLYNDGILPTDIWVNAINRYGLTDNITQKQFFTDKYCVWIDFRTFHDNLLHGAGIPNNVDNGISLAISRTATTKNLKCHMYIVNDAVFEVQNNNLKSIVY